MDEVREHSFDGIEEYDNPLPRWWLYLFYLTIVIAVVYSVFYPSTWFWGGTSDWSASAQYEQQMADAAARWPQTAADADAAELEKAMHDPAAVAAGKSIFGLRCAVCHGKNGEGKIGPSLTDATWKYGSDAPTVAETITKGRPAGMPPWGKVLSPDEVRQVTAFVLSLGKGPQASLE